jgi:hypothetical protein
MRGEFDALGFAADKVVADCPSRQIAESDFLATLILLTILLASLKK